MREVGRKQEYKASELQSIRIDKNFDESAIAFPRIPADRQLLCVFDKWGLSDGTEQMFICESIEDINQLLQQYNQGWALKIGFVTVTNEHFTIEEKMSREEVVALMKSSASKEEWNRNCDTVKSRFDGDYPPFWFGAIIASGVISETQRSWPKQSTPTVMPERLSFVATSHKESIGTVTNENEDEDSADKKCSIM